MERMTLALRPREGSEAELARLLEDQQDPGSPDFHRWLTPEEFGKRFGADDRAFSAIFDWLQGHGFAVDGVAAGRQWIHFSGTAAQVEETFRTPIHEFISDESGRVRHSNVTDPSLPRALVPYVRGVLSLHDFPRPRTRSDVRRRKIDVLRPFVNFSGGDHGLGPADFGLQYHVTPLYSAGIDGTGVSIAVVGRTDIQLSDVQQFRSYFGLPARDPVFLHDGPDPGNLGDDGSDDGTGEESEADLDVEWAGAVARNATITLVISKSTSASDAADLSAQYAVDNNIAAVLSSSFGACERDLESYNDFYNGLWRQAAAQGMTVFTPSGDSGAAECDNPTGASGTAASVSGLCSTPYNVCVGGTGLNDLADPAAYWSETEDPATHASLIAPVPENVWNESGAVPGGANLFAGGGGPSAIYDKPSWQSAPGVPNDGKRDTPDVSLNAAAHDGYVVFQRYDPADGSVYLVNGTSASTVAFAGLMGLVVQSQAGARQGNPNPVFYSMARSQYTKGWPPVFRDVVSGNNSVPGVPGFSAGAGYDLASGLGSVDASELTGYWAEFLHLRRGVIPTVSQAPAPRLGAHVPR
jgi:subtilase family serine protease